MSLKDKEKKWKLAVDRGGTFTDVVALDPDNGFHTLKLLSSSPDYDDPCIEGIIRVMGLKAHTPLPAESISGIRFGTTAATNALLERKGGRVALFITKGFRDLLAIGYQSRPDIFALCIEKGAQLYTEVIEVDERMGPGGDVVKGIDLDGLEEEAVRIKDRVDAAAVVFMHSWKDPAHELKCAEVLERIGLAQVHLSHRAINLIRIVTRGQSAMVDAYLSPALALYLEGIKKYTGSIPIEFIESSGGLVSPGSFKGRGAVFSGPAGGVIAVGTVARESGARGAIGFDMGGTSTDVSRYDGLLEKVYEQSVGGIELQGEALKIVTIASGGGSILWFDGQRMRVGPESAGARPGPACYGFGGPLTITDANLLTGRISKEFFPKTFGPKGRSSIDPDIVREEFKALAREINASLGTKHSMPGGMTPEEAALGFLDIANEKMALAIKEISVSKGFDVREYALVSFGGAGPQHACAIAERLGMREILFHPLGGLMSAYGIGLARPAKRSSKTVLLEYSADSHTVLASILDEMVKETVPAEWSEGVLKRMEVDLRPLGADTCLTIEFTGYETTRALFEETYKKLFGFFPGKTLIEAVNLRLEVGRVGDYFPAYRPAGPAGPAGRNVASGPDKDIEPHSFRKVIYHGTELEAPVYVRGALPHSFKVMGPAILVDEYSSLVIDPGFEAGLAGPAGPACDGIVVVKRVASEKACLQKRAEGPRGGAAAGVAARPDPVLLEVFNNLFMGVATEMGHVLQMTAHSVNIKERLDFSCALFDANADLVASAQHIPVHIGAMSDIVRAIMEDKGGGMAPGDVYVSNNPFRGGTHLPDVTVIEPVFSESGEIIFFVAARGHHADIGGKTPGSLPPVCSHIDEEGVLLDGVLILRDGRFRERELRDILSTHKYPARNPDERISDIKAQMASCSRGVDELNAIIDRYGLDTVSLYMGYIQENAEYAVKRALYGFLTDAGFPGAPGSRFESGFADALDDGTPIKVKVTIKSGKNPPETLSACIDFTGTGPWHASDNLNAPLPVTRSAVLYVLKTLIEADIPLNSGCLKPVEIIVPEGSLLNPAYPAPVGSGNVETSQRVVDVLLGALGIAAASQGTMNNLLFEVHGETPYYETIAGGSGAMDNCEGASGVQVHMTNTRITDPEVLEFRHPGVRLERFSLRRGSGGKGEFAGGDGVVREIRFLKPATVSIISERRVRAPYGLNGGSSGKRGENLLKRADGEMVRLGHRAFVHVKEGESVIIKTPGGGGYGKKAD